MTIMQDSFETLPASESLLLASMTIEDRTKLLQMSRQKTYAKGTMILGQGEPGSMVLLIEAGRVEVSVTSLAGRKSVLNHMGPGEVLGEIAMLDGGLRSANAVAASDVTGRVLSRQHIMGFLADHPDVAFALIGELCRKVRNASDMYTSQALTEGGQRLARGLLRLFEKWGEHLPNGSERMTQKFSQSDIGEFAGLARENVNRYLKAWATAGILETDGRLLVLHDRTALTDLAEL